MIALRALMERARGRGSRAAAPDGDRYFAHEALVRSLEEAQNPLSRTTLAYLDPADFLRLAEPGYDAYKQVGIEKLLAKGTPFSYVPALWIRDQRDGTARVEGHEGRHRARALAARGVRRMPVRITVSNFRWGQASEPGAFGYVERFPTVLTGEGEHAHHRVAMPESVAFPRRGSPAREKERRGAAWVSSRLAEDRPWFRRAARVHDDAVSFSAEMQRPLLEEAERLDRGIARAPDYYVVLDAEDRIVATGPTELVERRREKLSAGERVEIRPKTADRRDLARLRREIVARRAAWEAAWGELAADDGTTITAWVDPIRAVARAALFVDDRPEGFVSAERVHNLSTSSCREDVRALVERLGLVEPPVWIVHKSSLDGALRGRGFGLAMYERLLLALDTEARGPVVLIPDVCGPGGTSRDALRVWTALARRYASVGKVVASVPIPAAGSPARRARRSS